MHRPLLIIWLAMTLQLGHARDVYHSIRNYTAIDGLPQSQVEAIVEDSNGYLWIGTQGGGLARFDGREFKVYTTLDGLLTNFISGLVIDKHNNLWILHPQGITKYDGLKFTRYPSPYTPHSPKSLRRIFQSNNSVFACTMEGNFAMITDDSVFFWNEPVVKGQTIVNSHRAPGGELCFYMNSSEFVILDGDKKYSIPAPGEEKRFNFFDHNDEVWVQGESGIYRLNLAERKLDKVPFRIPYHILLYDGQEDTYWTRDQNNLFRYWMREGVASCDTVLKDVSVAQVLVDSERNVWFATDGRGLFKYYFQDFERVGPDNLRGVMAIQVDREGAIWIGTMSKGLWKMKDGELTSYADPKSPYRNVVHEVRESPDGTLWVATVMGLGKYNRSQDKFSWLTHEDGLSANAVMCFDFDDAGGMWIATAKGIDYFNGKEFRHYTQKDGLSSDLVWSISFLKQKRTLFLGNESGINTIKDGRIETIAIPELENTMVFNLNPYRDSLMLIGSGGSGVIVFDPETNLRKSITTRDGLNSDFVYFVAADEEDRIWIGTEKGISRILLNKDLEIIENLHYDYDNGLIGIETNQNAFYLGKRNKYFGLIDGLYAFNDLSENNSWSFKLHLTDVELLYGEYSARAYSDSLEGFFKIPVSPILPPDKNHITFHFNRVDKRYPKSVKFKYFLQNFDKTWSQPSSSTQVTYSNLPPGKYVFRVMATDHKGSWSNDKIAYAFMVRIPFYRTASFIAGIIIFVAGSITLLLYLRVRQRVRKMIDTERIRMKELEGLRKEIARDFHDEMGNQLTRIINYVSLLKLNAAQSNGNGHHNDLYAKVEESAKFLYTGTRDFIWSIDPVNDELSKLFIHIRDFGEKLFEEKNIQFRAYDQIKERVKLPNGYSREANLIFKEAMTNAFKHSEASNVTLTLKRAKDRFQIIFEDDGKGFQLGQQEKSNGLKNIRERAKRIGAVLRIHTEENQGVCITLEFTLTKSLKYGTAL
jgi:signal transduction histidine kinase/ligand-binding sensor domain-containing protein